MPFCVQIQLRPLLTQSGSIQHTCIYISSCCRFSTHGIMLNLRFHVYGMCQVVYGIQMYNKMEKYVVHCIHMSGCECEHECQYKCGKWIAPWTDQYKCKRECNRITRNFDVPSQIRRKKDMPAFTSAYRIPCMQNLNLMQLHSFPSLPLYAAFVQMESHLQVKCAIL